MADKKKNTGTTAKKNSGDKEKIAKLEKEVADLKEVVSRIKLRLMKQFGEEWHVDRG